MSRNISVLTIGVIALLLVIGSIVLKVRFFESGSYWDPNTKQLQSDKVGRLEATGEDLRIYEFTPQSDSGMRCIYVAGTNKSGLVCYPKTK